MSFVRQNILQVSMSERASKRREFGKNVLSLKILCREIHGKLEGPGTALYLSQILRLEE